MFLYQILKNFRFSSIENLKTNLPLFDDELKKALEEEESFVRSQVISKLDGKAIRDVFSNFGKEESAKKQNLSDENKNFLKIMSDRFRGIN